MICIHYIFCLPFFVVLCAITAALAKVIEIQFE